MNARFFTALFFLTLAAPAAASSPGMVEGPPGCSWNATVSVSGATNTALELQTIRATCMYEPGPCGKSGDVVTLEVDDPSLGITEGATVQVWVTAGPDGALKAVLQHPVCTKKPAATDLFP